MNDWITYIITVMLAYLLIDRFITAWGQRIKQRACKVVHGHVWDLGDTAVWSCGGCGYCPIPIHGDDAVGKAIKDICDHIDFAHHRVTPSVTVRALSS